MARKKCHTFELFDRNESGAKPVVDIVVVVCDLVREIAYLCFKRRLGLLDEPLAEVSERLCIPDRTVLENALARFVGQVESVKSTIALFEQIDGAQGLQVVFESAVVLHAGIERVLPRMSERGMPQIMRKRNGFGEILVQAQCAGDGTCDLADLKTVRQSGSEQIALMIDEYLCLVLEPPEGRAMNDTIAVTLKLAARGRPCFGKPTTSGIDLGDSIRRRDETSSAMPAAFVNRCPNLGVGCSSTDHCLAEAFEQYQPELSIRDLLVVAHEFQVTRRTEIGADNRQACSLKQVTDPFDIIVGNPSETMRQISSHHSTGSHRLAVQPLAVAETGFDRMTESVSEIEQRTFALFGFVGRDYLRLVAAGALYRIGQRSLVARQQRFEVRVEPDEEVGSRINPYLMTSARPARNSRSGSVFKVAVSANTSRGW